MILTILSYLADVAILGSYAAMTRRPSRAHWFHWANAVGFVPLVIGELLVGAYPVIPLTGTFGVIGAWGVIKHLRPRRLERMTDAQLRVAMEAHVAAHQALASSVVQRDAFAEHDRHVALHRTDFETWLLKRGGAR